jgi:hypothetical protein
MYNLYVKADRRYLGEISDDDLAFLRANLEEESSTDTDYSIARLTLEFLRANGLGEHLAQMLDSAIGSADEVEVTFEPK